MSDGSFSFEYKVQWQELDPNFHLRAAVLVDYAVNTQFAWLEHLGFKQAFFAAAGYEPIILRSEARYHHEATYNDTIRDTPTVTASSPDCSRWKIKHTYLKNGTEKIGWIILEGTWLNWKTRQAVAPDLPIAEALNKLPRSSDFEELKSFVRARTAPSSTSAPPGEQEPGS
ncbi:MAG TPA: acyl-CoA thioesterase [Spirochaetia bacterium]|nr:acyl-CoA thioesterase [Spirochaetia bacterium]